MKELPDGEILRLRFGRVANTGASVPVELGACGSFLDRQAACALNPLLWGFPGGCIPPTVAVYPLVAQMVESLPGDLG